ncbi:MAG: hypothetical protein ABIV04_10020 [Massilia sp.]
MPIPTPEERPDLYDYYDYIERPKGWVNPVRTPERIQRLIDAKELDRKEGVDVHYRKLLDEMIAENKKINIPGSA